VDRSDFEDLAALFTSMSYPINLDEYGLHAAPGGLTEGLPDYWSTTQTDRSAVGIFDDGSSLRDVDNSATCPESVVGEAHQDGVVIGGATYGRLRDDAERPTTGSSKELYPCLPHADVDWFTCWKTSDASRLSVLSSAAVDTSRFSNEGSESMV
jgi:hypothetical protein